ncbi:hypothetical protein [Saccharopolyspora hattusasensis]|uniref:hypothetical protein n=1 Tax=Saccharopolyspora hattusasensis TaxID=1128679 RepID=UPI003D95E2DD
MIDWDTIVQLAPGGLALLGAFAVLPPWARRFGLEPSLVSVLVLVTLFAGCMSVTIPGWTGVFTRLAVNDPRFVGALSIAVLFGAGAAGLLVRWFRVDLGEVPAR